MPRARTNKRKPHLRPKSGPKESAPGKKAAKRQSRLLIAEFNAWGIWHCGPVTPIDIAGWGVTVRKSVAEYEVETVMQ